MDCSEKVVIPEEVSLGTSNESKDVAKCQNRNINVLAVGKEVSETDADDGSQSWLEQSRPQTETNFNTGKKLVYEEKGYSDEHFSVYLNEIKAEDVSDEDMDDQHTIKMEDCTKVSDMNTLPSYHASEVPDIIHQNMEMEELFNPAEICSILPDPNLEAQAGDDTVDAKAKTQSNLSDPDCGPEAGETLVATSAANCTLKCAHCPFVYEDVADFDAHMQREIKTLSVECEDCEETVTFQNMCQVSRHIRKHLENKTGLQVVTDPTDHQRSYECKKCGVNFSSEIRFEIHLEETTDGKETKLWACTICDQKIKVTNRCLVYQHIAKHNKPIDVLRSHLLKNMELKIAMQKVTKAAEQFVQGQNGYWLTGVKGYHCSVCKASYHTSEELEIHLGGKIDRCSTDYSCQKCGHILPTICALLSHADLHSDLGFEGKKTYMCPECGICFTGSWANYAKHVIDQCLHVNRVYVLECSHCEEVSTRIEHLVCHMESHLVEYFKCRVCDSVLIGSDALTRHLQITHQMDRNESTSTTITACFCCEKTFETDKEEKDHIARHVNEAKSKASFAFLCYICNGRKNQRTFLLKEDLRNHMKECPTSVTLCEYCKKQFNRLKDFLMHKRQCHAMRKREAEEHSRPIFGNAVTQTTPIAPVNSQVILVNAPDLRNLEGEIPKSGDSISMTDLHSGWRANEGSGSGSSQDKPDNKSANDARNCDKTLEKELSDKVRVDTRDPKLCEEVPTATRNTVAECQNVNTSDSSEAVVGQSRLKTKLADLLKHKRQRQSKDKKKVAELSPDKTVTETTPVASIAHQAIFVNSPGCGNVGGGTACVNPQTVLAQIPNTLIIHNTSQSPLASFSHTSQILSNYKTQNHVSIVSDAASQVIPVKPVLIAPNFQKIPVQPVTAPIIKKIPIPRLSAPVIKKMPIPRATAHVTKKMPTQRATAPVIENRAVQPVTVPIIENRAVQPVTVPIIENRAVQPVTVPIIENRAVQPVTAPIIEKIPVQLVSAPVIRKIPVQPVFAASVTIKKVPIQRVKKALAENKRSGKDKEKQPSCIHSEGTLKMHPLQLKKSYYCVVCMVEFPSHLELKQHMSSKELIQTDSLHSCPKCNMILQNKCAFQLHKNLHSKEHMMPAACPECGEQFVNEWGTFMQHVTTDCLHHRRVCCLMCTSCEKAMPTVRFLGNFQQAQTPNWILSSDWHVQHCSLNFQLETSESINEALEFQIEKLTLRDVMFQFCCHIKKCSKMKPLFNNLDELWGHMKTIHKAIRAFTCTHCYLKFPVIESLQDHIASCHTITLIDPQESASIITGSQATASAGIGPQSIVPTKTGPRSIRPRSTALTVDGHNATASTNIGPQSTASTAIGSQATATTVTGSQATSSTVFSSQSTASSVTTSRVTVLPEIAIPTAKEESKIESGTVTGVDVQKNHSVKSLQETTISKESKTKKCKRAEDETLATYVKTETFLKDNLCETKTVLQVCLNTVYNGTHYICSECAKENKIRKFNVARTLLLHLKKFHSRLLSDRNQVSDDVCAAETDDSSKHVPEKISELDGRTGCEGSMCAMSEGEKETDSVHLSGTCEAETGSLPSRRAKTRILIPPGTGLDSTKKTKFVCELCSKVLSTIYTLKRHMKLKHDSIQSTTQIESSDEDIFTTSSTDMDADEDSAPSGTPESKVDIVPDMAQYPPLQRACRNPVQNSCPFCGLSCKSISHLLYHVSENHSGFLPCLFCPFCEERNIDVSFTSNMKLKSHLIKEHANMLEQRNLTSCVTNPINVSKSDDYSTIEVKHNKSGTNIVKPVDGCESVSSNNSANQPKVCHICSPKQPLFNNLDELWGHMNTFHKGIRAFTCSHCSLKFPVFESLKDHIASCHTQSIRSTITPTDPQESASIITDSEAASSVGIDSQSISPTVKTRTLRSRQTKKCVGARDNSDAIKFLQTEKCNTKSSTDQSTPKVETTNNEKSSQKLKLRSRNLEKQSSTEKDNSDADNCPTKKCVGARDNSDAIKFLQTEKCNTKSSTDQSTPKVETTNNEKSSQKLKLRSRNLEKQLSTEKDNSDADNCPETKEITEGHIGDMHQLSCHICKARGTQVHFSNPRWLERHLKQKHRKRPRETEAKDCMSECPPGVEINVHSRVDSKSCSPPPVKRLRVEGRDSFYTCAKCSFISDDSSKFAEHIKDHNTDKANQCLECGLCFTILMALKKHLFVVHKIRDSDKYLRDKGMKTEEDEVDLDAMMDPYK